MFQVVLALFVSYQSRTNACLYQVRLFHRNAGGLCFRPPTWRRWRNVKTTSRVFSRDVTAAMLVSLNIKTAATLLLSPTNPPGKELYHENDFFVSAEKQGYKSREWKHSITCQPLVLESRSFNIHICIHCMYVKRSAFQNKRLAVFTNRELKHARFWEADGNRKRTFRALRQWHLPDFYTNHL